MANQVYKSSDFLTATLFHVMSDGTEVAFWDDHSVSITQVDEENKEHTVLIREGMFLGSMLMSSHANSAL